MVSELDDAVGRIIRKLTDEGILDNTLIWFMSDNGGLNETSYNPLFRKAASIIDTVSSGEADNLFFEFIRVNVLEGRGSNLPYKRGKQSIYEGGVHVPSVIYWKGTLEPNVFSKMLTVQDVLPSVLQAAQLPPIESKIDGQRVWGFLVGQTSSDSYSPTSFVTTAMDGQAYYQFPWKLIELSNGDLELYHLERDPTENSDISETHLEKVSELKALLDEFPRAESIHVSTIESMMNVDFFGGEETSPPWAEVFD